MHFKAGTTKINRRIDRYRDGSQLDTEMGTQLNIEMGTQLDTEMDSQLDTEMGTQLDTETVHS